jgi:hypothetical protein
MGRTREEMGGIRLKEVEGRRHRRGVEESKGFPQESRPGSPMCDRVKAACLDENTHILQMHMT